ncbi:MAG: hypothetical protein GTN82_24825 [Candidatus Aminicenantes bacterium]|nr:hypothetical protein [Candidatus Aminicenantes bacterium]NIN21185.1 hypothetical protein [Candidatus Aminicenantes bacterium]NIN45009.1 hypothetical protein [Candidatus Aminicenantes bacterium]NIR08657.1 hypothetical protein [Candidatus Aminicenantes bacterium]
MLKKLEVLIDGNEWSVNGFCFGGGYIWIITYRDNIIKIDTEGNILNQFNVKAPTPGGTLCYDNGTFWVPSNYTSYSLDYLRLYHIDDSGNVIGNPIDISHLKSLFSSYIEGIIKVSDGFWLNDVSCYSVIYKIDMSGNIISQFPNSWYDYWSPVITMYGNKIIKKTDSGTPSNDWDYHGVISIDTVSGNIVDMWDYPTVFADPPVGNPLGLALGDNCIWSLESGWDSSNIKVIMRKLSIPNSRPIPDIPSYNWGDFIIVDWGYPPLNPSNISGLQGLGYDKDKNRILIAEWGVDLISAKNVNKRIFPVVETKLGFLAIIRDLVVKDGTIWLLDWWPGGWEPRVIELNDKHEIKQEWNVGMDHVAGMATDGNNLWISGRTIGTSTGDYNNEIKIFDFSGKLINQFTYDDRINHSYEDLTWHKNYVWAISNAETFGTAEIHKIEPNTGIVIQTFETNWLDPTDNVTPVIASDGNSLLTIGTTTSGTFDGYENDHIRILKIQVQVHQQSQISLSRSQLYFGATTSGTSSSPQTFFISNSGEGTLNWAASSNRSWLSCTPKSGTGSGTVNVAVAPTGLSAGTYTGSITITDSNATNSPQTVSVTLNVYNSIQTAAPFGQYATPTDGSIVRSSVPVTGWVLDELGVQSVKLYLQNGSSLTYIGDAVFVEGARPDIEQAYPGYPLNYKAGWGYMMLTNFLPNGGNGTFKLLAVAADYEGNTVTLGTKTITCDNANAVKPFGAIDTPTQGGTASGNQFINWGWVLTPKPNIIPTDGSTIDVWVDGVKIGKPTYNIYRSDIALLFPGYANSDGAIGYFYLDTTKYANGVHIIQWTAKDNADNSDGIGSRYFTIGNTGVDTAQSGSKIYNGPLVNRQHKSLADKKLFDIPLNYSGPIRLKKGYGLTNETQVVYPDENGLITAELNELERLTIHLQPYPGSRREARGPAYERENRCTGYLVVGDELRPLPIGSTLDAGNRVFYWQPGPGFVGHYRFIFFMEEDGDERMRRKDVDIMIWPKYGDGIK